MSYDVFFHSAPAGVDPEQYLDALLEGKAKGDFPDPAAVALRVFEALPPDLGPVAARMDEMVVLADGTATVECSPGLATLEISYGVPLAADQFLAMVEGVGEACAAIGYDQVVDPQLGRAVLLGSADERPPMIEKWNEGLEMVARLREEAEAGGPPKRKRWWRRG